MAVVVFHLLATTNANWGQIQIDGSTPAASLAPFGWKVGTNGSGYMRGRLGAAAVATAWQSTTWLSITVPPVQGTGTTITTAGNAWRTPTPLNGTFAAGNFNYSFGFRTAAASATGNSGRPQFQIWKSANADGSGAVKVVETGIEFGSYVGPMTSTTTTYLSTGASVPPSTVTFNNEYMFVEMQWNISSAAANANVTAQFYQSACTITSTEFTPAVTTIDYVEPAITAGAVPITGSIIADVPAVIEPTLDPGALPITGLSLADVTGIGYGDTLAASALPISGSALADTFGRSDTIVASTVPIVGQTIADVPAVIEPTLTPSTLPITGGAITDAIGYRESLTASSVPITGQSITPIPSTGGINYTEPAITPSSVPIGGQVLGDVFARTEPAIAPSAVPIGGLALADTLARADTLTASAVPITGLAVAPIVSGGYSDSVTPSAVPITGQLVADRAAYQVTISASTLPIGGAALADIRAFADTLAPSSVPITGQTLADRAAISAAITAGALPIDGRNIVPIVRLGTQRSPTVARTRSTIDYPNRPAQKTTSRKWALG